MLRLPAWTVFLPLLIVSCVPPVRDRYLLPMAAPAAILAAVGLSALRHVPWLAVAQWLVVAVMALAMPVMGLLGSGGMRTIDGTPMFAPLEGILFCAIVLALLAAALRICQRRPALLALCWSVLILTSQMEFAWGSRLTSDGYSTIKRDAAEIGRRWPTATAFSLYLAQPPRVLPIYLGRSVTPIPAADKVPDSTGPQLLFNRGPWPPVRPLGQWRLGMTFTNNDTQWFVYERGD
jgi:hypothetical protein